MQRTPSNGRSSRLAGLGLATAALLLIGVSLSLAPAAPPRAHTGVDTLLVQPSVESAWLNVSATTGTAFTPNQLTAPAGALVHLKVTQLADFDHTFVLSPQANFSFPTSDTTSDLVTYFNAHTPLVNLSLGTTPGASFFANFTAPAPGTYEFVCVVNGHFAGGMFGTLTTTSPGSSPAPASTSDMTLLIVAAVVVVLVVVAAVAMLAMRRRKTPPTPPAA